MTENSPVDATFKLFHRYNKLVRRGLVKPLACKSCGAPYVTSISKDDELILKCLPCEAEVTPGTNTIERVYAVVTEHFVDE